MNNELTKKKAIHLKNLVRCIPAGIWYTNLVHTPFSASSISDLSWSELSFILKISSSSVLVYMWNNVSVILSAFSCGKTNHREKLLSLFNWSKVSVLYRRHQVSALGLLDISLNNNLNFKLANWQVFVIFSFFFFSRQRRKEAWETISDESQEIIQHRWVTSLIITQHSV